MAYIYIFHNEYHVTTTTAPLKVQSNVTSSSDFPEAEVVGLFLCV